MPLSLSLACASGPVAGGAGHVGRAHQGGCAVWATVGRQPLEQGWAHACFPAGCLTLSLVLIWAVTARVWTGADPVLAAINDQSEQARKHVVRLTYRIQ